MKDFFPQLMGQFVSQVSFTHQQKFRRVAKAKENVVLRQDRLYVILSCVSFHAPGVKLTSAIAPLGQMGRYHWMLDFSPFPL